VLYIGVISSCGFRACFSREGRKLGQNTEEDYNEKGSKLNGFQKAQTAEGLGKGLTVL